MTEKEKEVRPFSRVYARFIYDPEKKKNFNKSTAVIGISVGQAAHEGKKLEETIRLAKKTFKSVSIAVGDVLQRHTMGITERLSKTKLHEKAKLLGDEWIDRNSLALAAFDSNSIIRWEHWLKMDNYREERNRIVSLYDSDEEFARIMDKTISEFENRIKKRVGNLSFSKVKDASFEYLIEECTVMMLLWEKNDYNYIVYPSKMLGVVKETHNRFVKKDSADVLEWVQVKLKTIHQAEHRVQVMD